MKLKRFLTEQAISEGTEQAKAIRDALKKKFKLTNRDVSVKARSGGTSSAVNVTLKSAKALPFKKKIAEIGSGQEHYQRDMVTQQILRGGNTFVFTELDWKFRETLVKKIEAEINKKVTDEFLHGEGGGNTIKVYGDYTVVKDRQSDNFWVSHPKKASVGNTYRSIKDAAGGVLSLMLDYEDSKALKKLG